MGSFWLNMSTPVPWTPSDPVGSFIDRNLRAIGQVMLQNNPITGLLFLVGIFINDWRLGLYGILGTIVATESALWLGASREDVKQGLFGFNGILIGVGLALFLQQNWILPIYIIIASIFASVVTAAIMKGIGIQGHALTAPFNIVTWIFVAALVSFGHLHPSASYAAPHLLAASSGSGVLEPIGVLYGILNGPAQVFFQHNIWTGVIFFVALAVNSRMACAMAILGSALALGVGLWLGADAGAIQAGLLGYNGVLVALALSGVFVAITPLTVFFAAVAVCVSTVLYSTLTTMFAPFGLSAMTAPFVIVTWFWIVAGLSLGRLDLIVPRHGRHVWKHHGTRKELIKKLKSTSPIPE